MFFHYSATILNLSSQAKQAVKSLHTRLIDLYFSLVKITVENSFNKLSRYNIRFIISLVKISSTGCHYVILNLFCSLIKLTAKKVTPSCLETITNQLMSLVKLIKNNSTQTTKI